MTGIDAAADATDEQSAAGAPADRRTLPLAHLVATYRKSLPLLDPVIALLAGALVLIAHNVGYIFRTPYWLDESWVAVSTKMPLSDLRHAIGPSPAIWAFLLRAVPGAGAERQRIVPLLFAWATVSAAYFLLRALGRSPVEALFFGAAPALLCPAMLVRDDLKQYTADAFVLVLMMLLVTRLDTEWSHRRLMVFAVVAAISPGISSAAYFVTTASVAAVMVSVLVSRQWRQFRDLGFALGVVVVGYAVWLGVFVLPSTNTALTNYWNAYYPARSLGALHLYFSQHAPAIAGQTGFHSPWVVFFLVIAGVVTMLASGQTATALVLPIAFLGALLGGLLRIAPFLDSRTSTWLSVGCDVVMAIGVLGIARLVARGVPLVGPPIAVLGALVSVLAFAHHVRPGIHRVGLIPYEDSKTPSRYVQGHRGPHDAVVVDNGSNYGYAYYSGLAVRPLVSSQSATGFYVRYPVSAHVATVSQHGAAAVEIALRQAEAYVAPYPGAKVWVIRVHISAQELPQWARAFSTRQMVAVAPNLTVETPR